MFATLTFVQVSGDPQPDITWFRNGKELDKKSKDYVQSYDGKLATLTIEDVMTDDSAEMKVVAENNAGKVESSCKLEVKGNLVIFYKRNNSVVITPANEVCEGYVFTPVCQSFCSGGCLPQCMLGYTPPSRSRPPQSRHPLEQTPPE